MTTADQMFETLAMYATPSEAYWRAFELEKLRELRTAMPWDEPVLEIGCGSGVFSSLLFSEVHDAIDINPRAVERARCLGLYRHVHCMDAGKMSFASGVYGTVFANCVLEHIPALEGVLSDSCRVLRLGGKVVATVPLLAMNDYLLLRTQAYANMRQRQLSHVNLLSAEAWATTFRRAGFATVQSYPYFFGGDVRFWDPMDFPASIGASRYRVSTAVNTALDAVPTRLRAVGRRLTARWLATRVPRCHVGEPCATALVATKGVV